MNEKQMIETYTNQRPVFQSFTDRLKELIIELLRLSDIKVHLIEARAKTVESFAEKIRRPGKSYQNPLEELTDLSGIRVIVYYQDDVEKVAQLLDSELNVIESEVSHQPSKYSPDQFGYISLHYVVKLSSQRTKLPEWKVYKKFKSEIQIRTVLQHSWAAVSHALQYKHESDVPKQLRRKLFRLAGLFELADEEFVSVRDTTIEVRSEAVKALESGDNSIAVDPVSLNEFILRWERLGELREYMEEIGYNFNPPDEIVEEFNESEEDTLGTIAFHCERIGINTIEELLNCIDGEYTSYLKNIYPGDVWYLSETFLVYLLLIRSSIQHFTVKDLIKTGWGKVVAERVIKAAIEDEKN